MKRFGWLCGLVLVAASLPNQVLAQEFEWPAEPQVSIFEAAASGDDDAMYQIIASNPRSVLEKDDHGDTALHIAIRNQQAGAVVRLLNAGSDYDAKDGSGTPPLHLAIQSGDKGEQAARTRLDIVQYLLLQGSSVKSKDARGRTPLHIAAMMGRYNVLDAMYQLEAPLDAADDLGRTAMHLAAQYGELGVLNWFERKHLSVSVRDRQGVTPLMLAAEAAQPVTLKRLLELGAHVSEAGNDGRTGLHLLAASESKEPDFAERALKTVDLLIEAGANPLATDAAEATPI